MAKLHVITYGCQMNEYDSERVAGLLREHRYELTDSEADADLILVNTCAIREKAEEKVFSELYQSMPPEPDPEDDEAGWEPLMPDMSDIDQAEAEAEQP